MTEFLKKKFIKRAWRTFFQTAVGYITVNVAMIDFGSDTETLKAALLGLAVSAISGGISAVMNLKEE